MLENETRAKYIDIKLENAGWLKENIRREYYFTDGRILIGGKRGARKFADYLLHYKNSNLAIIEAKRIGKDCQDGLQQGKEYAKILNIRYVYSTNGHELYEYDMRLSKGEFIDEFPSPDELYQKTFGELAKQNLLSQKELAVENKQLRYYQKIAVDSVIKGILQNKSRMLLTLATGTGKTTIAFAIVTRLLNAGWNKNSAPRKPKILFLCDRISLRNQALGEFNPIENDCVSLESSQKDGMIKSANVYFGIYQSLASEDKNYNEFYTKFPKDFFDLIIIDECHRGGANENGSWQEILKYFESATQLGLTATPKRDDNVDTYKYFGESIYKYSLKDGINDGFLTPYKVKKLSTSLSDGYIYSTGDIVKGELEKPRYKFSEFEKNISIPAYNDLVARLILENMENPMDKTIIFCANQKHASEIRHYIDKHKSVNHNDYCVRVTSDEGKIGLDYLSLFQDNDKAYPVILTSSKMLTTGVDARNVRNIVLLSNIASMVEFKQIIGRGTRVYKGKDFFTIIDFTDSTNNFYDKDWDGEMMSDEPIKLKPKNKEEKEPKEITKKPSKDKPVVYLGKYPRLEKVEIKYTLNDDIPLDTKEFLEAVLGKVRAVVANEQMLRQIWSEKKTRLEFLKTLEANGISDEDLEELKHILNADDCDLYDVFAYLSFGAFKKSRKDRVQSLKNTEFIKDIKDDNAMAFMNFLLDKYERFGIKEFDAGLGTLLTNSTLDKDKIAQGFGSKELLKASFEKLQEELFRV